VVGICLLLTQSAIAGSEVMPLAEVEPGMTGVGKTVISGTTIEEFKVEVVSILPSPKQADQPLILVKTSGEVIEKTGGIASGMSGSPVYINDRLIGAIGYGWEMTNHKIGMVTPIKSMRSIFELEEKTNDRQPEKKNIKLDSPIKIGSQQYNKVCFADQPGVETEPDTLAVQPATTPLLVSGLSGRAKRRLKQELEDYEVKPIQASGVVSKDVETKLKPGSALAIQLVRGDINVSAIGTLTYRDQDEVLGFGHPFLSLGDVNYLLSSAYIHKMINSVKMPFKIGSPVEVKGIVNQDRTAGVAGKVGEFPNVIPVEVEVVDKGLARNNKFEFQIVQNKALFSKLSAAALLQAIDSTIDRKGGGTAKISLEIMGSNLPGKELKVKNLYYNQNDIAAASITDFLQALELINNNPFREVNIANINFKVEIEKTPRSALIEEVKVKKEKVKPGEKMTAQISFRPYREEVVTEEVEFKIPKEIKEQQLSLHVLSGQEANLDQALSQQQQQEEQRPSQLNNVKSLEELVNIFTEKKQNNQVVVELRADYSPQSNIKEKEAETDKMSNGGYTQEPLAKKVFSLDYVLQGAVRENVEVVRPQEEKGSQDSSS